MDTTVSLFLSTIDEFFKFLYSRFGDRFWIRMSGRVRSDGLSPKSRDVWM